MNRKVMVLKKIGPDTLASVKERKVPPKINVRNIELTNDDVKSDLLTPIIRSTIHSPERK